jgi:hypothetical protein
MSHETFEAISNPNNGGWTSSGGEIGDLCRFNAGPSVTAAGADLTMSGHGYDVQEEWSNLKGRCDIGNGAMQSDITPTAYPACTATTLPVNDDGSSPQVSLPFTVNFYSKSFASLWVNNNGNVTFDGPQATYTPFGLLSTAREIIAPFFGDVDTRGAGSGTNQVLHAQQVTYGGAPATSGQPAYFCVNWTNVGYYGTNTNKLNSFQLVLVDRSGLTGQPGDFDIVFNYDKVQWETGDASGGSDGLGGFPAVAGYSNGSTQSLQLPGSGVTGALEDDGTNALTQGSLNSATTPGRYVFAVRNGGAPNGGTIHGTVTDLNSDIIRGAPVQLCGQTTFACTLTQTNGQGTYAVSGLQPDSYAITVNPPSGSSLTPGYGAATIGAGDDATVDVFLGNLQTLPPHVLLTYHRLNADGTPILEWGNAETLGYYGCVSGQVSATIALNDGSVSKTFDMPEITPLGVHTGQYSANIPNFFPASGPATVTVTATCPDPTENETVSFTVYIDPSGTVVDQNGSPVNGATVTLLSSENLAGPFSPVPDGSPLMSPGNRTNPDTTTSDGTFGWDVLTGFYQVQASAAGCTDPGDPTSPTVSSVPFAIPPPMTQLHLVLNCTHIQTTPALNWPTPAPITYGTALSATQLDATASVPGTFTYAPAAGSVLGAGSQTLSVTFRPTDTSNYTTASATVALQVNRATPVVSWASPTPISYGTALSATQLDATASVPGTFTYTPAAGSVLGAGSQTLSVTFTPTDTSNYTTATATVTLQVNKATPTLTWAAPATILYGAALSAAQLNAHASVAGTFVYTPPAGAVLQPGTQTLAATFTPTDSTDYNTASINTQLVVGFSQPCITTTKTGPFTVASGQSICLASGGNLVGPVSLAAGSVLWVNGGSITGTLTVSANSRLWVTAGSITGPITASGATALTMCATKVTGQVTVTGTKGPVVIGGTGCAGNTITAAVSITSNTGGVGFSSNKVTGSLTIKSNSGGFQYSGNIVTGPVTISGNS